MSAEQRIRPMEVTCQRCGHKQMAVFPWKHIPTCAVCRKPVWRIESNAGNIYKELGPHV